MGYDKAVKALAVAASNSSYGDGGELDLASGDKSGTMRPDLGFRITSNELFDRGVWGANAIRLTSSTTAAAARTSTALPVNAKCRDDCKEQNEP